MEYSKSMSQKKLGVLGMALIITSGIFLSAFQIFQYSNLSNSSVAFVQSPPDFVSQTMRNMTLQQKVASLLILHTSGNNTSELGEFLHTIEPGGLIMMGNNIGSMSTSEIAQMTEQLQTSPELPYLIATDEEGGVVKRLFEDNLPAAIDLKSVPPSETKSTFKQRSEMLKGAGINLNFGIIADVTSDPNSFIYSRVFGGNPTGVSERIALAVEGEKGNVLSTLKHYPGHGETRVDSHFIIPTSDISFADWQTRDEPPFSAGIKAGAQVVMFGHLIYSSVDTKPASLSKTWHEILRDRDNFSGITITDDMLMLQDSDNPEYADPIKNAIDALNAGNTMLLYVLGGDSISASTLIEGITTAVENGELNRADIYSKVKQVLHLRRSLAD